MLKLTHSVIQGITTAAISSILLFLIVLGGAGCGKSSSLKTYMNGVEAFKQGHYALACKKLDQALSDRAPHKDDAPAYNLLGLSAVHSNDDVVALASFKKSHELDDAYYDGCYNLGYTLCRLGQVKEGAPLLLRAASLNKKDARPLELLAVYYEEQGMVNEARSMLQVARQRDPASPRILTRIAALGLENEGAAYTSSYLKEALQLDQDYAAAVFNQAVLHDQWVNDREGALGFYRRYLKLAGTGPRIEQAESAIARLEQAIARDFDQTSQATVAPVVYPSPAEKPPEIPLKIGVPKSVVGEEPPGVSLDPDSVDSLLANARAQLAAGQETRALNLCLQAAAYASRRNDVAEEERALRTAVELCAEQPRAHFALGRYLSEREEHRQAMRAFERAAEIEPQWEEAHLSMAASAIVCKEFQAALGALREAVKVGQENPDALWALALFYDTQLKLEGSAHRSFSRFVARFPKDHRVAEARARLATLTPDTPMVPVTVRRVDPAEGATPPAPKTLSHQPIGSENEPAPARPVNAFHSEKTLTPKLLTPKPPSNQDYRERAMEHFEQGSRYQAQGDFDRAALYYQQAINEDSGYAPPFYNMGIIYQKRSQLEFARNAYAKAVENDPTLTDALFNMALIRQEQGDPQGAMEDLHRLLVDHPGYARAHFMLAQSMADAADKREVVRTHYTKFLELMPDDPGAAEARRWLLQN